MQYHEQINGKQKKCKSKIKTGCPKLKNEKQDKNGKNIAMYGKTFLIVV